MLCYIQQLIHCLEINRFGFPHNILSYSVEYDTLLDSDSFIARSQIQCCAQCLRVVNGLEFHHALFKQNGRSCICKRDFDRRLIPAGAIQAKQMEIRQGYDNNGEQIKLFEIY